MTEVKKVSTSDMDRAAWLELRKKSIGGSDAAGIVGLSKYSSPYSVWADKTGRLPDREDTEAMRLGRDLEQYVADRFMEETGKQVEPLPAFLYNPLYPFAHANVDRMVVGEDAGLECKTTSSLDVKQFKGVEFPEKYYVQCVHYLAVTGCERWYLAVLVFGRGFFVYTLERDQAEIDALMRAEADFWQWVASDTPPAPDGRDATTNAIGTIYAESQTVSVELPARDGLLEKYITLKRQSTAIEDRMAAIANIIKTDMGDAEAATGERYRVTWRTQKRRTFQVNALAADYPEIDLTPYYKTITVRPFKISEEE